MGMEALARSIYNDINKGKPKPVILVEEARAQANEIYRWHKATFVDYWRFLNKEARAAQSDGYTTSADGWFYFADRTTAFTKLMNFPMQSNGAVMLREAVKMLAFETDLDVACTLHDAIYVNCREEEVVEVVPILTEIMDRAVERVIGTTVKIEAGVKVYTHEEGYRDQRGEETLARVTDLLGDVRAAPAAKSVGVMARLGRSPPLGSRLVGLAVIASHYQFYQKNIRSGPQKKKKKKKKIFTHSSMGFGWFSWLVGQRRQIGNGQGKPSRPNSIAA